MSTRHQATCQCSVPLPPCMTVVPLNQDGNLSVDLATVFSRFCSFAMASSSVLVSIIGQTCAAIRYALM